MAAREPTSDRNLDGYGAPPIPWIRVRERLEEGLTQAPGTAEPTARPAGASERATSG